MCCPVAAALGAAGSDFLVLEKCTRGPRYTWKLLNSDSLSIQTKNSSRTVPITVRQHPTKGFVTGVITVPNFEDIDEEDILKELRDQVVQMVRRLQCRENVNKHSTIRYIRPFSGNPPSSRPSRLVIYPRPTICTQPCPVLQMSSIRTHGELL